MSESNGWREEDDPEVLAAAVAAGVEVVVGNFEPSVCTTAEDFADCMGDGTTYRVPADWSPTPEPPADDSDPPEVKRRTRREVTADFIDGTRTIREWVNGGGVDGPRLCEELDAWLDYWGGWSPPGTSTPVPPWPGAVLSGLCDEDGEPTWLAQAGQVRGESVRAFQGYPWLVGRDFLPELWVEVRAPRAEPEPETERVPWWELVGRTLVSHTEPVERVEHHGGSKITVVVGCKTLRIFPLADGTVEVLKDGGQ